MHKGQLMKEIMNINHDFIESVKDNSDTFMKRVYVTFKNGETLSIIRGEHSYGGDKGLFEIMPSVGEVIKDQTYDCVLGHLSINQVNDYIYKVGTYESRKTGI